MSGKGLFGRVRSSRARAWQSSVIRGLAPSCVLVVGVVDHPGSHMVGSDSLHCPNPIGLWVLGPASGCPPASARLSPHLKTRAAKRQRPQGRTARRREGLTANARAGRSDAPPWYAGSRAKTIENPVHSSSPTISPLRAEGSWAAFRSCDIVTKCRFAGHWWYCGSAN